MTRYRRRNYFIKKGFQSRFIFPFLIVSFLGLAVSVSVFVWTSYEKIDSVLYSMRIPREMMGVFFYREAVIANIAAVAVVAVMFVFTAGGLFKKVTGPLSAAQYGLRRLIEGDLRARIQLRAGDEFADFAGQINAMAKKLDEGFHHIDNHARQLEKRTRDFAWARDEENRRLLKEMMAGHVAAMEEQLKAFRK